MAAILKGLLGAKGISWDVKLSRKIVPKITVSGKDKTIYVNETINYTFEEVERLKVHEIQVHVYRGANGEKQPLRIFSEGLADYDETEEGLAIIAEEKSGCLDLDTRQMKLYAGRALATEVSLKNGFYYTFRALKEFFPDDIAYRLTESAKRGLENTAACGGFTKGHHYIAGLQKVRQFIEQDGDISILYTGKIGVDDVEIVKRLLEKKVLVRPEFLPEFLV